MTKKLYLSSSLSSCPSCWQNFIREYNETWDLTVKTREIEIAVAEIDHFCDVNVELQKRWNARLNGDGWDDSDKVEFNTEQDKLMFMLRWS